MDYEELNAKGYKIVYHRPSAMYAVKYQKDKGLEEDFITTLTGEKVPVIFNYRNEPIKVDETKYIVFHPNGNKSVWSESDFNLNYSKNPFIENLNEADELYFKVALLNVNDEPIIHNELPKVVLVINKGRTVGEAIDQHLRLQFPELLTDPKLKSITVKVIKPAFTKTLIENFSEDEIAEFQKEDNKILKTNLKEGNNV